MLKNNYNLLSRYFCLFRKLVQRFGMNFIVTYSCIFFCMLSSFAFATEVKVLKIKNNKALIKILSGEELKKNEVYTIGDFGSFDNVSENNSNSFNRNFSFAIASSFSNIKIGNKEFTENKTVIGLSKNESWFEYGIGLHFQNGSTALSVSFGGFLIENKINNFFIPFLGLSYLHESLGAGLTGSSFVVSGGIMWFPASQNYWSIFTRIDVVASGELENNAGNQANIKGHNLNIGIVNYF